MGGRVEQGVSIFIYICIYISVLHTSLTVVVLKALASLTFLSRFSSCLLVLLSSRVLPHQRRGERNGHLHFGLLAWKYHDVRLLGVSLHLILIFRKCLPVKRTLGITHYRGGGVQGQRIASTGEVTGQILLGIEARGCAIVFFLR